MSRIVEVFADWASGFHPGGQRIQEPQLMGSLRIDRTGGKEVFSFEYDSRWLVHNDSLLIDPELGYFLGPQYLAMDGRVNFGLFLDSSPDRWGRMIMRRREALLAKDEGRRERQLFESDYLLGVHDPQRMGAIRFRSVKNGPFVANDDSMEAPPWARLRELEQAARRVQMLDPEDDTDLGGWLKLLIAPGSSIGGARPKAGVCDQNGNLWIAKFPGTNDEWDVAAWELLVHRLAVAAGLRLSASTTEQFGKGHRTFLTKRFDRTVQNNVCVRHHFASAMTMLGYSDGTDYSDGASYLEIAEFLVRNSTNVEADLHELFRRVVFSICVSNTDDHLRNHGFLLTEGGWQLAPAYDMNPNPAGAGLSLNISETDNSLSLELAINVCDHFRLDRNVAEKVVQHIVGISNTWRDVASELKITRREQAQMEPAFRRKE